MVRLPCVAGPPPLSRPLVCVEPLAVECHRRASATSRGGSSARQAHQRSRCATAAARVGGVTHVVSAVCALCRLQSAGENLAPQAVALLARQVKALASRPPDGVKYVPTDGTLAEITAEISGPGAFGARGGGGAASDAAARCAEGTPYEGGVFVVKLVLGRDYPGSPPKGYFLTRLFHPNVSTTGGEICVNTLKRDWKPDVGIGHVLQVIRCLLIVPFPESSLNDDAGRLFMESYDEFCRRARLMTRIHAMPSTAAASAPTAGDAAPGGSSCEGGRKCAEPLGCSDTATGSGAAAAGTSAGTGDDSGGGGGAAVEARLTDARGLRRKEKEKKRALKRL